MPGATAAPSAAAEQDDASGTMPRDSLGCHEQDLLVSVAALEPAPVPEEELIDISMDSPVDGEDARWYKCASVAAFNATLEFSATTPIGGKVMPDGNHFDTFAKWYGETAHLPRSARRNLAYDTRSLLF